MCVIEELGPGFEGETDGRLEMILCVSGVMYKGDVGMEEYA